MKIPFSKSLLVVLFLCSFLSGCNLYKGLKHISREEYVYNPEFSKFKFEDNKIIIHTKLSTDLTIEMLFDLGAASSIIFLDSTFRVVISDQKPIVSPGKSISADGVKMKKYYYQFGNVSTQWFSIKNCFISSISRPIIYPCNNVSGIWGVGTVSHSFSGKGSKIVIINMQDTTLGIVDKLPSLNDWIPIETTYIKLMDKFRVKIKIGTEIFNFYFDTGFTGSLAMKRSDFEIAKNNINTFFDETKAYGYITNSLSGTSIDTAVYFKSQVSFNNTFSTDSILVFTTNSLAVNVIGMDFLKRFNMLVDYQNHKLYFQPNPNFIKQKDSFFIIKGFKPKNTVSNGICIQNIYVNSAAENAGLKVGDQIISINNIKSDPNNNCEIVKLFSELDSNSSNNEVVVKRGDETLKFVL